MKNNSRLALGAMCWLACAGPVLGGAGIISVFVEGFEDGDNEGQWSWGANFGEPGIDIVHPTNGNPDAWLGHQQLLYVVPTPTLATDWFDHSLFTGDYADEGVIALGLDLQMVADPGPIQYDLGEWVMVVMLMHHNGTPGFAGDDTWAAWVTDQTLPEPEDGWVSYDFAMPSQETELPDGWVLSSNGFVSGPPAPLNHTWEELIHNVGRVAFCMVWEPAGLEGFYAIQNWFVGADNLRITRNPQISVGDLNGDGVVNAADLALLLGAWGPCPGGQACSADLNGDGAVNAADLALLLGNWG